MLVLELDQVETDYCPNCQGIWLDSGELELFLEDSIEKEQFGEEIESSTSVPSSETLKEKDYPSAGYAGG